LYDLAQSFSVWWTHCTIKDEKVPAIRAARRSLVLAFSEVIRKGLDLIGIPVVERM
jgi:arginyl-tRNA synthetase